MSTETATRAAYPEGRRIHFRFEDEGARDAPLEKYLVQGDMAFRHFMAGHSGGFLTGREACICSVRKFADQLVDPALKKRLVGFIGQEPDARPAEWVPARRVCRVRLPHRVAQADFGATGPRYKTPRARCRNDPVGIRPSLRTVHDCARGVHSIGCGDPVSPAGRDLDARRCLGLTAAGRPSSCSRGPVCRRGVQPRSQRTAHYRRPGFRPEDIETAELLDKLQQESSTTPTCSPNT